MSGNDDCGPRTAGWVVHRLCSNYPSAERVCLSSAFCIELGGGQRLDAYVMFSYRSLFAPHVSLNLLPQPYPVICIFGCGHRIFHKNVYPVRLAGT